MQSLLARIYALDPDVILIDLENPSRDVLEQMFQVSRAVRRPIAMFVRSERRGVDPGFRRRRRLGLYRRRIEERTHQADPRPLHLAIQRICQAAG